MNISKAIILGRVCDQARVEAHPNGNRTAEFALHVVQPGATGRDSEQKIDVVVLVSRLTSAVERFTQPGAIIYVEGQIQLNLDNRAMQVAITPQNGVFQVIQYADREESTPTARNDARQQRPTQASQEPEYRTYGAGGTPVDDGMNDMPF